MQSQALKIIITISTQRLQLLDGPSLVASFPVSTSALGTGFEIGSHQTPTGRFRIREIFGEESPVAPLGMIFRSRIATGELGTAASPDDLIQTRILWLDGLDAANANTYERYIYLHGTNHEAAIGAPVSHGCVRMRNADIASLTAAVPVGVSVQIEP